MNVVRLSASRTNSLYLQEKFLVLTFTRGCVDHRAMVESSLGLLHLGLIERTSVPHIQIVPSVISRGASHHAAQEASISGGRKLHTRILPSARNELQLMGSFTCPKFGTWDRLFDFPSEARHAEDFFRRKNSAGFEPANSGTRGQHANH
jgi:hypothetical protein